MPSRRDHLRASKKLLGTANPLVHTILDYPSPKGEHRHRHTPSTVRKIEELLVEDETSRSAIRREGWLHLLMDWGIVKMADFSAGGLPPREKRHNLKA